MDKVISEIQARHDFAMAANEQFGLWNPERVMEAHKDRHTLLTKIEQRDTRIKQLEAVRGAAKKTVSQAISECEQLQTEIPDDIVELEAALAAVENGEVL